MAVSLTVKPVAYDTYSVSGKTLPDIAKSIKSKGPKDPNDNKKVTFLTSTELECLTAKGKYVADGKAKIDKKTGWFEVTTKVSTLKLILHTTVRCPKRSVSGLSPRALIEWYRFYACCLAHEGEHLIKAKKECEKIAKELDKLKGTGLAETEAEALKLAQEDLIRVINIHIFDDRNRLNEVHRKFDHSSHHGEKKGALLDTSVG
ncbi:MULTISPECIES: DUF922 domain-containing protein [Rhodobacterales]|jgi:predicted secreted Zn-dependent protease|uniref:DUF922 domain-containing protein n=1 Tax=Rhodobacterales TaxID=204455 RepID=UPI00237FB5CC|nr:DUF922 domain-containing protein [Phaeobacter gallaeciensis]MDE4140032.1 DUF922 domain-containing protein [Phaeobacter gallaeciensis]MDE4148358.1 DUF922 domain-containing protein [Phaeobacter gallaeciensis]MDE4152698.1 DUF922 domain-containing protein [Phaeobacter gallaeciensis]MDE4227968.1 DUF922 domain-containing protein [Phaeobacter gallaeciensis]MDE4257163.1 DUF922 domain-containing protein [Phaeobacter gallaeciensis]